MDEPDLYNESDFLADVLPILDRDGVQSRIVIVKATYALTIGEPLALAEKPRDIRLGNELWGVPEVLDVRLPGDLYPAKPGTDFVLSGHAVAPLEKPCTTVEVGIAVADRVKRLRVHGPRLWRRSLLGVVPGPSAAMLRTPLAWSRAYGGADFSDPARPVEEPRNPVGSGIARDAERLVGTPAPQIEAPDAPIGSAGSRIAPAGCAAIGPTYEPRRTAAGTYDDAWIKSGYPARPRDYKDEHENFAAADLVFREPLRGGEPVRLVGVRQEGLLAFELPKWQVVVRGQIGGRAVERRPHLDTVVVDTDAMLLELVWRGLFRCPPKMRDRFTAIHVHAKPFTS
jgi:hypothetical protein